MHFQRLSLGPLRTNCYVLCCETSRRALVIDPGADEPALREAVRELEVPLVVATHGHWDHVSGVPWLQEHKGSRFVLHHAEREELKRWRAARGLLVRADDFVGEGDRLEVGSVRLQVLHLPGHSPGHLVLMEASRRWLFTGDLIMKGRTGGANVPGGDPQALVRSLNRLRAFEGDWTLLPGHFEPTTLAEERLHNPYLRFRVVAAKGFPEDAGASAP